MIGGLCGHLGRRAPCALCAGDMVTPQRRGRWRYMADGAPAQGPVFGCVYTVEAVQLAPDGVAVLRLAGVPGLFAHHVFRRVKPTSIEVFRSELSGERGVVPETTAARSANFLFAGGNRLPRPCEGVSSLDFSRANAAAFSLPTAGADRP